MDWALRLAASSLATNRRLSLEASPHEVLIIHKGKSDERGRRPWETPRRPCDQLVMGQSDTICLLLRCVEKNTMSLFRFSYQKGVT